MYEATQPGVLRVTGNTGVFVIAVFDIDPGPINIPGLGELCVGLSSARIIEFAGMIPESGYIDLECAIQCDSAYFNTPIYAQAVSFIPKNEELCLSNCSETIFVDTTGICGGSEGCTPGYWKQPQHFDSWPSDLPQDTPFSDIFDDAFPGRWCR